MGGWVVATAVVRERHDALILSLVCVRVSRRTGSMGTTPLACPTSRPPTHQPANPLTHSLTRLGALKEKRKKENKEGKKKGDDEDDATQRVERKKGRKGGFSSSSSFLLVLLLAPVTVDAVCYPPSSRSTSLSPILPFSPSLLVAVVVPFLSSFLSLISPRLVSFSV